MNEHAGDKNRSGTDKKPYEAPEVVRLGSVEDLTKGPEGGSIDSLFGGNGGFQSVS